MDRRATPRTSQPKAHRAAKKAEMWINFLDRFEVDPWKQGGATPDFAFRNGFLAFVWTIDAAVGGSIVVERQTKGLPLWVFPHESGLMNTACKPAESISSGKNDEMWIDFLDRFEVAPWKQGGTSPNFEFCNGFLAFVSTICRETLRRRDGAKA